MRICKRRHFYPMLILGASIMAGSLCLLFRLAAPVFSDSIKEYQTVVSLGRLQYDEKLLEQVKKIPGLVSFSPVLEIPVELKLEEYTMSTVFLAVDLNELKMEEDSSEYIYVRNTPVLLIGKNTLESLKDLNNHTISKRRLVAFWEKGEGKLQYCLSEAGREKEGSDFEKETEATEYSEGVWTECPAFLCLRSPSEGIYISLEQGKALGGMSQEDGTKALLTVRGKEAFKKAQDIFANLSK